ncbi:hypothetical protein APR12_002273 [Nocardia amikacinitolerans]|nr:hypothetical protein [Nocardia amikacinitolerans]
MHRLSLSITVILPLMFVLALAVGQPAAANARPPSSAEGGCRSAGCLANPLRNAEMASGTCSVPACSANATDALPGHALNSGPPDGSALVCAVLVCALNPARTAPPRVPNATPDSACSSSVCLPPRARNLPFLRLAPLPLRMPGVRPSATDGACVGSVCVSIRVQGLPLPPAPYSSRTATGSSSSRTTTGSASSRTATGSAENRSDSGPSAPWR